MQSGRWQEEQQEWSLGDKPSFGKAGLNAKMTVKTHRYNCINVIKMTRRIRIAKIFHLSTATSVFKHLYASIEVLLRYRSNLQIQLNSDVDDLVAWHKFCQFLYIDLCNACILNAYKSFISVASLSLPSAMRFGLAILHHVQAIITGTFHRPAGRHLSRAVARKKWHIWFQGLVPSILQICDTSPLLLQGILMGQKLQNGLGHVLVGLLQGHVALGSSLASGSQENLVDPLAEVPSDVWIVRNGYGSGSAIQGIGMVLKLVYAAPYSQAGSIPVGKNVLFTVCIYFVAEKGTLSSASRIVRAFAWLILCRLFSRLPPVLSQLAHTIMLAKLSVFLD